MGVHARLAWLLAGVAALVSCAMQREAPGVPSRSDDHARLSAIDALMERYTGDGPGAALLVLRDGEALVARGFGLADIETKRRVSQRTNFRLASVTKQFTAAAILLLAEDGRLTLDDKLRRWLPSLPAESDAITLRHV